MARHLRKSPILIGLGLAALCGCRGPGAFIREGGPNSVEIAYSQSLEPAQHLARGHCMRYEKMPVLANADGEIAVYNCVPLQQSPAAR